MSATLVGDPGAEEHFQGVALTRCKGTVTPEDEATAIHLGNEIKKLATKMGRLLACLRLTSVYSGDPSALILFWGVHVAAIRAMKKLRSENTHTCKV